jgi:acyl-homoserine lactone acylase PvdQ
MKRHIDKVGYAMGKIHDTKTNQFVSEGIYPLVKRIECYYGDDGIYGFFPFYNNELDKRIMEDGFYKEFEEKYKSKLDNLVAGLGKGAVKKQVIKFTPAEVIDSFTVSYDDNSKKVMAIKIKTTREKYQIGKVSELNKAGETIHRKDYFITGFKTTYFPEKELCYLSYISVYYENDSNYEKYYKAKIPSMFMQNMNKRIEYLSELTYKWFKFFMIIFMILFPMLFYYTRSQNIYGGELLTNYQLTAPVRVYTDDLGFVHIKAENKNDGYFGIGFAHAKERLWHMDFMRRVARGKLAEILGEKALVVDKLMRSLGLNNISTRNAQYFMYNSQIKDLFMSYIDGINYYAKNFFLPPEYYMTFSKFDNWDIVDTIAIQNLMSLTLSHDWNMELWYKVMEENLGKEFAEVVIGFRDLNFPFADETIINDDELTDMNLHKFRKSSETIIKKEREQAEKEARRRSEEEKKKKVEEDDKKKTEESKKKVEEDDKKKTEESKKKVEEDDKKKTEESKKNDEESKKKVEEAKRDEDEAKKKAIKDEKEGTMKLVNITTNYPHNKSLGLNESDVDLGLVGNLLQNDEASNSWVISGKHTQSGFPILSNDPHLSNSMPCLFFIIKLYLPEDTLVGATMPGIPIVLMGSNKQISFGMTTENSDVVDICEEQIDDEYYNYDGQKVKITTTEEIINVRGREPEYVYVKWTRNGPLVEKLAKEFVLTHLEYKPETPISLRFAWYFYDYTSPDFYYALNFAKSSSDFLPLVERHISPNLNLIWASTSGEIGYVPLGKWPIKNYINRFCRGYTSEDDFKKYIKRAELPQLVNPKKGFIVTANNKPLSFNYTYDLHGFHNQVRAYRIREMIEDKINNFKKFDINDNIEMLKDVQDAHAVYSLPQILEILQRNGKDNLRYYKEFKTWDHRMEKNSTLATIWAVLEVNLAAGLLKTKVDDITAKGIISFPHYWNFVAGIIDRMYKGEKVELKQCYLVTGSQNCEKYIAHIFSNLDEYLKDYRNGPVLKQWGELKFQDYPHAPFDVIPVINKIFSRKVYTGGNRFTVKIGRGAFNHPKGEFISTHSARLKFINDLSNPTEPYLIIDTGNSGNILSKYYDNLMTRADNVELEQMTDHDFETDDYSRTIVIKQDK